MGDALCAAVDQAEDESSQRESAETERGGIGELATGVALVQPGLEVATERGKSSTFSRVRMVKGIPSIIVRSTLLRGVVLTVGAIDTADAILLFLHGKVIVVVLVVVGHCCRFREGEGWDGNGEQRVE